MTDFYTRFTESAIGAFYLQNKTALENGCTVPLPDGTSDEDYCKGLARRCGYLFSKDHIELTNLSISVFEESLTFDQKPSLLSLYMNKEALSSRMCRSLFFEIIKRAKELHEMSFAFPNGGMPLIYYSSPTTVAAEVLNEPKADVTVTLLSDNRSIRTADELRAFTPVDDTARDMVLVEDGGQVLVPYEEVKRSGRAQRLVITTSKVNICFSDPNPAERVVEILRALKETGAW